MATQQVEEVHAGQERSGRPATDRDTLVAQGGSGHRPAVVRGPDHVVVRDEDIVEEHLVEIRIAR